MVAVMTHPLPCPRRCNLCPEARGGAPKSHMPDSPVVLRAGRSGFDPYRQVAGRIKVYPENGHVPSKVEVVVMGGTFSAALVPGVVCGQRLQGAERLPGVEAGGGLLAGSGEGAPA